MFQVDSGVSGGWRTAEAINSAMLRVYNYMFMAINVFGFGRAMFWW